MTGMRPKIVLSLSLSLGGLLLATGCAGIYDVAIERPARSRMDLSPFHRILVAGFVPVGTDEIDADLETTRLLRSQLRSRSSLTVIDADAFSLLELAVQRRVGGGATVRREEEAVRPINERELDNYRHIFAQAAFWKRIGEEYQEPLIVTGTVLFRQDLRGKSVQSERELFNVTGQRAISQTRKWETRKVFELRPTFIFIDGRTGAVITSETYEEAIEFNLEQGVPALSAYFELMDRVLPKFLGSVSAQRVREPRVLLK